MINFTEIGAHFKIACIRLRNVCAIDRRAFGEGRLGIYLRKNNV